MDYGAFLFNLVFFHIIVEEILVEVFRRQESGENERVVILLLQPGKRRFS